jgi:putative oxidoreductase
MASSQAAHAAQAVARDLRGGVVEAVVTVSARIERARNLGLGVSRKLAWMAPTLARLTLGAVFVPTGWGKLHNLEKVASFFAELHIPAPAFTATLVATTELVCGALLLFGLLTRLAALPLMVSMLVAILTAKRDELSGWTDLFGLLEWSYVVLLGWLVIVGAGPISIDAWIARRLHRRRKAETLHGAELVGLRP